MVARTTRGRKQSSGSGGGGSDNSNVGIPANPSSMTASSIGHRNTATINRVKLARSKSRQRRAMNGAKGPIMAAVSNRSDTSISSIGGRKDRYDKQESDSQSNCNSADSGYDSKNGISIAKMTPSYISTTPETQSGPTAPSALRTRPSAASQKKNGGTDDASTSIQSNMGYEVGLTSALSADDDTIDSTSDDIKETALYRKFEEAFNVTLHNNPGILPGAPTVIESIKKAMYKIEKSKAQKEHDMRDKLDKAKADKAQLEAQLRKEMGHTSLRKAELARELEAAKKGMEVSQDSLTKQLDAITAMKVEMTSKLDDSTKEKEELMKHLGFLSKSRQELARTLDNEMELVEKDRDALQQVVRERKDLQNKKAENKALEGKIERLTHAANKEKRELQAEVADLNKFEEHVANLKRKNATSMEELEHEKKQLKQVADVMQTKKNALLESKNEMKEQYQKEIEELELQVKNTKMMHETEMEAVVKNRMLSYLKQGEDVTGVSDVMHSARQDMSPQEAPPPPLDIESLIKSKVESELRRRMEEEEEAELARMMKKKKVAAAKLRKKSAIVMSDSEDDDDDEDDDDSDEDEEEEGDEESVKENKKVRRRRPESPQMHSRPSSPKKNNNQDVMRSEIDRLREQLQQAQVQTRNPRHSIPGSPSYGSHHAKDGFREEAGSLREFRMNHAAAASGYSLSRPSPQPIGHGTPYSTPHSPRVTGGARSSTLQRNNPIISPGYYREEEERMGYNNRLAGAAPLLGPRSPASHRRGAPPNANSLDSRYYF